MSQFVRTKLDNEYKDFWQRWGHRAAKSIVPAGFVIQSFGFDYSFIS